MAREFRLPHLGGNLISAQISSVLMRELKSGEFAQSDKLPAEVDLALRLRVSRTVIRDALSDLEREGFIERVRGIGTVINRNIVQLDSRLDLKLEYYDLIAESGQTASTDSVNVSVTLADEELASYLEIDVGSEVVVCEKRVLADKAPVIFSQDYIPRSLFSTRDFASLNWQDSVFDMLGKENGARVTSNITRVRAVFGSGALREKMQMPGTEVFLLMEEVSFTKLCRPVMRSLSYYTSFFNFSLLRKKF